MISLSTTVIMSDYIQNLRLNYWLEGGVNFVRFIISTNFSAHIHQVLMGLGQHLDSTTNFNWVFGGLR